MCQDQVLAAWQVGLFGTGDNGPAEQSPTAGLSTKAGDSTSPPEAFKGQPANDTQTRNETAEIGSSASDQVGTARVTVTLWAGTAMAQSGCRSSTAAGVGSLMRSSNLSLVRSSGALELALLGDLHMHSG